MPHTCVTSIGGAQPWPVDFTVDETVTYGGLAAGILGQTWSENPGRSPRR
jgi:hypothetical protein